MQLLRTILIIILVYYLIKIIARYVLPVLAKYFIRKAIENSQNPYSQSGSKKGDIRVDHPSKKIRNQDNLGEYIDYEEIDEK
jgi:hypothetical protein